LSQREEWAFLCPNIIDGLIDAKYAEAFERKKSEMLRRFNQIADALKDHK